MSGTIQSIPAIEDACRISHWLAHWHWSEGSGGNFSLRMDKLPEEAHALSGETPRPLPITVPSMGGSSLLISGRGTRARDIAADPKANLGLYWIIQGGEEITCLWGNCEPTSELPSHLAIHETLLEIRPSHKAVLHTHPPNLIALTHLQEFQDSFHLSDVLLRMQSEARIHLPEGIALLPYYLPGSLDLGLASVEALRRHSLLLWHMHGALTTGETLSNALDQMEVADKAAEIFWLLASAGRKSDGISNEDMKAALQHFDLWDRYLSSLPDDGSGESTT
ncbi:MAG: rhamnulose-1-phosphate aldolase [Anaerolineales bacterium]|nr:rhamnulose-1-phosphate aldolase [Anaerolineales bacterium]